MERERGDRNTDRKRERVREKLQLAFTEPHTNQSE